MSVLAASVFLVWGLLTLLINLAPNPAIKLIRRYDLFKLMPWYNIFSNYREKPLGLYYSDMASNSHVKGWERLEWSDPPGFRWYYFVWNASFMKHQVLIFCCERLLWRIRKSEATTDQSDIIT